MSTSLVAAPAVGEVAPPAANEPEALPAAPAPPPTEAPEPDAPPASEAGEPSDPGTEAPAPAAPATDKKVALAPDKQPKTAIESRPFSYRVDRQQIDVPDAIETKDGFIVISRQAWNTHVQPNLADWRPWQRERHELRRQLAERDPEKNALVQQARSLVGEIEKLRSLGPEKVVEWALNFLANAPVLEANARASVAEARSKQIEQDRLDAHQEEIVQHYARELPRTLRSEVNQMLEHPDFKPLGLNEQELFETLWDMRHTIFFEAPHDMPEHGLRQGEIGFRRDVIQRVISRQASFVRGLKDSAAATAAARAQNAAAVNGGNAAPPAVTTKEAPAPAAKKKPEVNSYQSWVESLNT